MTRLLALSVCLLAVVVSGCGGGEASINKADTEGIWVDVGPLDFHVQGSRQLNPNEVPDDRYVAGVPGNVKPPKGNETWFGVFLRIENRTKKAAMTPSDFEIEDTEGDIYRPVAVNPKANAFAYSPSRLGAQEVMPHPDSTQEFDSTSGSMLLFKLPLSTYSNRPLEFRIKAPEGQEAPHEASVTLDL